MKVSGITITGEHVLITSDQFDWLCERAAKAEKLESVMDIVARVSEWQWDAESDGAFRDMQEMRQAVKEYRD